MAPQFAASEKYLANMRTLMSVLFNHAWRYEFFERNPIKLVRQSAKRRTAPSVVIPAEIKPLLDNLELRERTLVLLAASTGYAKVNCLRSSGATSIFPKAQ
jgi:site-specific recombinase XerD